MEKLLLDKKLLENSKKLFFGFFLVFLGHFFQPGTLFWSLFPAGRGSQRVCGTGVFCYNILL